MSTPKAHTMSMMTMRFRYCKLYILLALAASPLKLFSETPKRGKTRQVKLAYAEVDEYVLILLALHSLSDGLIPCRETPRKKIRPTPVPRPVKRPVSDDMDISQYAECLWSAAQLIQSAGRPSHVAPTSSKALRMCMKIAR